MTHALTHDLAGPRARGTRPADRARGPGRAAAALAVLGLAGAGGSAAAAPPKQLAAARAARAIEIDGRLDDEAWRAAAFDDRFVAKRPREGAPPSARTEIAVLFDGDAVVVGARLVQPPATLRAGLTRRDTYAGVDSLAVSIDGYADRRTAHTFGVTAAGTRFDHYHASDREADADASYDPVWQAAVHRDERGWTAELRIPLSQLGAAPPDRARWGVNATRHIAARGEDVYWELISSDASGWASRFGELAAVSGVEPRRRVEALPYVAADARVGAAPAGAGGRTDVRLGGDVRVPAGRHAAVHATVLPDFGQVEADPAELNLTTFETVLTDQRPFFVDQRRLLEGGAIDDTRYFYSRRLGAIPRPALAAAPAGAGSSVDILGAAKLGVRTPGRTSAGVLVAATDGATAATADGERQVVAPLTGYGIARVQQQVGSGGSTVGAIATAVGRRFGAADPTRALLAERALAGGADWDLRLADGDVALRGDVGGSLVTGSPEAIARIQRGSARYLQRPDREAGAFDASRRALGGVRAGLELERLAGARWLWRVSGGIASSGLELEDAGLLQQADRARTSASIIYRDNHAEGRLRRYELALIGSAAWNLDGELMGARLILNTTSVWRNDWEVRTHAHVEPRALSDRLTRGGPLMGTPRLADASISVATDRSRRLRGRGEVFGAADELGGRTVFVGGSAAYAAGDLTVAVEPSATIDLAQRQYVATLPGGADAPLDLPYGQRFVFGALRRNTATVAVRLGYAVTPDLTLDLYAAPFMTSGRYGELGELRAARSRELRGYESVTRAEDGSLEVMDGAARFSIRSPDFDRVALRSTAVVRWEWAPGSTLYVVWQQDRAGGEARGGVAGPALLGDAFTSPGSHTLAVKLAYWSQWL